MILRGEEISTPLTVEQVSPGEEEGRGCGPSGELSRDRCCPLQALDSRDSLAMALYSQCFNWIIGKINSRIRGTEDFKSISILDIFGFENFEVSLELKENPSEAAGRSHVLADGPLSTGEPL